MLIKNEIKYFFNMVPLYFFKYTNKQFMDRSSFRVGTLNDFRDTIYAEGISDPEEGKKIVIADNVHFNSSELDKDPDLTRHMLSIFAKGPHGEVAQNVQFENVRMEHHIKSKDLYIYSLSGMFKEELMKDFKSDSCFRITSTNIYKVIRELTLSLNAKTSNIGKNMLAKIEYGPRHFDYKRPGVHPALLKEKIKYGNQDEWRIIWEAIKTPIKPVNLYVPSLSQYFEHIR